jgi:hypothetical protein
VAEEQGQALEQPAQSIEEQAVSVAKGILQSEGELPEDKPRDEQGKFKPKEEAKPEEKTEEAKPEAEAAEEDVAEEDAPAVRKHKLTVKSEEGEDLELEVDEEELKRGYMLEKSYRHKTALIAREREAVQAKIKEATESKLKEYDEKLQLAEQAIWHTLAPEMQSIDWNKLATENPAEWAQKYQHVQNVNAKLAQIQQERKTLAEAKAEETKVELRKKVDEAVDTLRAEIPGWSDERYRQIITSGVEQGFKKEEVNAIIDPRAIKVLWKAMQYDALQKAKPSVEKRTAQQAPKVVKPGAGEKPDASADKWNEGMAKLQKTGRTEDAVDLARLILASEAKQQKK